MTNGNGNEWDRGRYAGRQEATLETIQDSIDRLEERLFGPDGETGGRLGEIGEQLGEHVKRIGKLERVNHVLGVIGTAIAGFFGARHIGG